MTRPDAQSQLFLSAVLALLYLSITVEMPLPSFPGQHWGSMPCLRKLGP